MWQSASRVRACSFVLFPRGSAVGVRSCFDIGHRFPSSGCCVGSSCPGVALQEITESSSEVL